MPKTLYDFLRAAVVGRVFIDNTRGRYTVKEFYARDNVVVVQLESGVENRLPLSYCLDNKNGRRVGNGYYRREGDSF